MPKKSEEPRVSKQFILEHLAENEIDLSLCNLTKVPVKELALVPRGTKLDLSRNQLTLLPDSFCTLKHLIELDLSNNQLRELPANFGHLVQLQKLDLLRNQLTSLPLSFSQLRKLRWLDLKDNDLEPGLAEVAGMCLSKQECMDCARKVLAYMKERAAEAERKKQKELAQQRELERQREEEERQRKAEVKRERAELRQRRKEEQERREAERRAQQAEKEEEEAEAPAQSLGAGTSTNSSRKKSSCRYLCWTLLFLLLLLQAAIVAGFLFCDRVYDLSACQEAQHYIFTKLSHLSESLGLGTK